MKSNSTAILLLCLAAVSVQSSDYPSALPLAVWTNSPSLPHSFSYNDGSVIRPLLHCGPHGASFVFGFLCATSNCTASLLSVSIVYTDSNFNIVISDDTPRVVWSANRHHPVADNATLQLSPNTGLVLRDADGSIVWSTNTSNTISSLNLTDTGNLVLLDKSNETIWSSFDHPTDSLLIGQSLREGQRLTASVSSSNWTEGLLYLALLSDGLYWFIHTNPPQTYYKHLTYMHKSQNKSSYLTFVNGNLQLFTVFAEPGKPDDVIPVPVQQTSSVQYMKLESDGHLRIYEWIGSAWDAGVEVVSDLDDCSYPTVCGKYGICSNGQCTCPNGTYFKQIDEKHPNLGCYPVTPLSCHSIQDHQFLTLDDVSYFNYIDFEVRPKMDGERCKQTCMKNYSCEVVIFKYFKNSSDGYCFLPPGLFSLKDNQPMKYLFNSTAYIKVQIGSSTGLVSASPSSGKNLVLILCFSLGALLGTSLLIGILIVRMRRKRVNGKEDEDHFDQVGGMPMRLTYEQLRVATNYFSRKLGEGGFGSVFEGTLDDGTRVAVKRLDGIGQGKKEFLAEVETIGSINHINLVRLVGFSAEKSHRLLVYEYMCNGSLEKWIFYRKNDGSSLDWPTRRNIITGVAKGLSYLHGECRQIIVHLDIKPQNILLDDKFNAKVSDFGLSKLINRDESHVVTRMRGTPGYLAPEWLTSMITEKVDVYSFGVVVMEIICGRKNLDYSQPEERVHLVGLLREMVRSGSLLELIDGHINLSIHRKEILKMMEVAMWCLQSDTDSRPSMSQVVKFTEGAIKVQGSLDYDFSIPTSLMSAEGKNFIDSSLKLPSILSGPR